MRPLHRHAGGRYSSPHWGCCKGSAAVCITLQQTGACSLGVLVPGLAAHPGGRCGEGCPAVRIVQPHGPPAQLRCLLQDALCADGGPQLLLPWRRLPAAPAQSEQAVQSGPQLLLPWRWLPATPPMFEQAVQSGP